MSTARSYAARILQVQLFIQQNLDEDLTLERLAGVAGYSTYHFHRIFRGQVGESTDDYVRRLRMEQAARSLRYRHRSVLEVALDAGYGSHEAFTRAFTRTYGMSPLEYQSVEFPPPALRSQIMNSTAYTNQDVRITQLPARRLACLRVVGPYLPELLGPAFERIEEWARTAGVLSSETLSIGVYHDDPEVTAPEKQRADVGVTVPEDVAIPKGVAPTGEVQIQTLPAGSYAVLRHRGPYSTLGDAYRWFYSLWLPASGREPAHAPPYEIYVNDCTQVAPEDVLTDICIPLAS